MTFLLLRLNLQYLTAFLLNWFIMSESLTEKFGLSELFCYSNSENRDRRGLNSGESKVLRFTV